ncbi:DUF2829 domain-containing protein [Pasteurella canis]|uniref:DUF2829 domain-containing protein n=1 Tax=Pasteurella canis TaxID=753 RepID=UPI001D118525|nr:DUF2829 domain-containing protein [Pasteurella canis]UDW84621.1 DUF2829 domain-containing protein [Pasteurella canis]
MGISFGAGVEALKRGEKISRSGWNGKGMYLFLVDGTTVRYAINQRYLDAHPDEAGLPSLDAIYMKTAGDEIVPWLASQSDILSDDWVIL